MLLKLLGVLSLIALSVGLCLPSIAASPPQPTYGTAVVDGNISEWNLATDFFANMYRAGNPAKQLEAKAYLRYDCSTHTLYVLVLAQPGVVALAQGFEADAWGAIGNINNKVYTGNSGNPPTPPQFAWVGLSGDHLTAQGYEASFIIASGTPITPAFYTLLLHVEVFDSAAAQTAATAGFPKDGVLLELICSEASIDILKSFAWTTGDGSHVGDVVTYTYTVKNTGTVPLNPVTVVDDKLGPITLLATSLAPGATTTGTKTLTLTQALLNAGSQTNTATATGTPPTGPNVTEQDSQTVTFLQSPSIDIAKTFAWTTGDGSHVGDVVTYTFTVKNTGNVTLNPVTVADNQLGPITLLATSLAPGATTTGTKTLTLTQALLDAGSQTNTATATGKPPSGPNVTEQDTQTVTFLTSPSIDIEKTFAWTTGDGSHVGDVVTYTFTVKNSGNVTLNPVTVTDNKLGSITLLATSLAPGASTTGTATLTLTQALLDVGSQTNTATATGKPPTGPNVTEQDSQTVTFLTTPSIAIEKTFAWTTGDGSKVGDVVTYTFTVKNTGNVTLNPVTVADNQLGPITLLATSLAPGASTTGTATLTVTQALLDAGSQTNTATATGKPPSGPNVSAQDSQTVTFTQTPSIDIQKTFAWTTGDGSHVGDVVTYTYTVRNTGNVTLNPVTVTDDKLGPITLLASSLAPGATTTGTATLTVTQPLLDAGSQTNTATATGTPPSGPNVTEQDSETVQFGAGPAIDIHKTFAWTTGDGSQVGDVVTYTYTVKNTGNVTLNPITVTDNKLGPITLLATSLAPGATTTGTATLTVTQALLDAGSQTNTATATGKPPTGPSVTDADSQTVTFLTSPGIDIQKTFAWTTGDGSHVGDVVTYTYTVKNTGNVTLNPVTVTDDKLGSIALLATSLAPGASTTGTKTLTLTQALLDAGSLTNTATATGKPPSGPNVTEQDSQTVTFLESPGIDIQKTFAWTTGDGSKVGDVVTYTYTVTNTGNVTLNPVTVTDDKLGTITLLATSLAPGVSTTGTKTLTLTQALLDAGSQTNTATATGKPPTGPNVTEQDSQTVTFLESPAIDIQKAFAWTTGDGSRVGDVVTYTYTVKNVGNVTLTAITVTDDKLGPITLLATTLAPGVSTTGTATLTLTQALLDAGSQTNTATATGTPPSGPNVTEQDSQVVTFLTSPSIDIQKTFAWTTGDGSHVGDVVTYTYTVINKGNVTLTSVTVTDDKLGPITLLATTLAPGAPTTGTATLTLTEALIGQGSQTNTATATGTPPTGPNVTEQDSQTVTFVQNPDPILVKSISVDGGVTWIDANTPPGPRVAVGAPVLFRYVIENAGNVTLTAMTLTDSVFDASSTPPFIPTPPIPDPFLPGATYTYIYGPVPATEGQHLDIATVVAVEPDETVVSVSDPAYYFGGPVPQDLSVFQAYPASSQVGCDTGYITEGLGGPVISSMPGILCLNPGAAWSNFIAAAQDGVPYTIKNTTFVKSTPAFTQCGPVFPAHTVTQHGTPNVRLWWPLMYETPGTTFTLSILYGTPALYDDDGPGPDKPAWVHNAQWTWTVRADFESLSNLLEVFHELPFGKDEVPLISDEPLYDALQLKVAAANAAFLAGDTATAASILADFELEVMDGCIDDSPAFPDPTGPGTGIANSNENPACCKLLVDIEYILKTTGIGMPRK